MQHDKDYSNLVPKDLADRALEFCVNSHLSGMGDIMYLGVAAFGMIFYIKAVIDKARGATSGSN